MLSISLPKKPKYEEINERSGNFIIEGCYPGYGTTLGNAIRRVLLSSLSGAAATSVKIKGATHEFTTLKGVKEDIVQIILNLKKIHFRLHEVEKAVVALKIKGSKNERKVVAGDIKCSSGVEISNPDHFIATITSSTGEIDMVITVEKGLGYVPVEQQDKREKEIGSIAIDAIFNPVERVNLTVENMRVGKRTDYDRIKLELTTNGTITPQEAYGQSIEILMGQFNAISEIGNDDEEEILREEENAEKERIEKKQVSKKEEPKEKAPIAENIAVETLNFSTRTMNVLSSNKLNTISDIAKKTEDELRDLEGMGDKGIKEIKKAISKFGIILKSNKE